MKAIKKYRINLCKNVGIDLSIEEANKVWSSLPNWYKTCSFDGKRDTIFFEFLTQEDLDVCMNEEDVSIKQYNVGSLLITIITSETDWVQLQMMGIDVDRDIIHQHVIITRMEEM